MDEMQQQLIAEHRTWWEKKAGEVAELARSPSVSDTQLAKIAWTTCQEILSQGDRLKEQLKTVSRNGAHKSDFDQQ